MKEKKPERAKVVKVLWVVHRLTVSASRGPVKPEEHSRKGIRQKLPRKEKTKEMKEECGRGGALVAQYKGHSTRAVKRVLIFWLQSHLFSRVL